jgi:Carboxypeptidase regulatory-like domain
MQFVRFSIVVLVLACLAVLPLAAQTTFATITGIVNDSAGGVVPGAAVEATHVKSNYKYTTVTNQVGAYTLGSCAKGITSSASRCPVSRSSSSRTSSWSRTT